PQPEDRYPVALTLSDGRTLYVGGLKLGFVHRLSAKAVKDEFKSHGPDPLDPRFTIKAFRARLAGKKGKLKATLTHPRFVTGIGTVYGDEILFEAGLHPALPVAELTEEESDRLYEAMQRVLQEASEAGGYVTHPLTEDDTLTGGFANRLRVFEREGQSCP